MQAREPSWSASLSPDCRLDRTFLTATFGFSVAALATLVALGFLFDWDRGTLTAFAFGLCLLCCSTCSWLYNNVDRLPPRFLRHRPVLRLIDHGAIFLLIAGTYTPFVASGILGPLDISLLQWVWSLALGGIALKLLLRGRFDRWFVFFYLGIGWLFLSAFAQVVAANPFSALVLLFAGGVAYTVGAMIFWRGIGRWTDAAWHGCVLAGGLAHFAAVLMLIFDTA